MKTNTPENNNLIERFAPAFVSGFIAQQKKAGWQRFYNRIRRENTVIHVNDCSGDDERTRLIGRSSEILGQYGGFIEAQSSLEVGAGILTALDTLDGASQPESRKHTNIILANIAPREGEAGTKYPNGTPFGYLWHDGTLIVSTVGGHELSLLKKLGLAKSIEVLDTRESLRVFRNEEMITKEQEARIAETQFRSFEFSPRAASYVLRRKRIPGAETVDIQEFPDVLPAIWHVDHFAKYGNCKTTLLPEDVFSPEVVETLKSGNEHASRDVVGTLNTTFGVLPVYRRLKDVPDGELAVIVGSSGIADKRFLEIVVQGGSAARRLVEISKKEIASGTLVF
jgi:hypothetical protein